MRVDPRVAPVEPDFPVALVSPTRRRWTHHLLRRIFLQISPRRRESECILVVGRLAQKEIEKLRPLIPPVAEKLGIKGTQDDRIDRQYRFQMLKLPDAGVQEVPRMMVRCSHRPGAVVDLLVWRAGDAVIFKARVAPTPQVWQHRAEIVLRQFHADVAVEISIGWIARIPLACAPDLLAGLAVASKNSRPGGCEIRRINSKSRPRLAIHESMGIHDKPP